LIAAHATKYIRTYIVQQVLNAYSWSFCSLLKVGLKHYSTNYNIITWIKHSM